MSRPTSCREARDVLAVWAETTDLPEPIAVHVGECPECRTAFDLRFPMFPVAVEPIDPAIRVRLLGPRRSMAPLVLAAAAAVLLVVSTVISAETRATEVSDLFPPDCPDEVPWSLPECPPA